MPIVALGSIKNPLETEHGEIIYELIGREVRKATTDRHSIAYVVIPPGKASLLHYHPEAEESYYITKGSARLLLGDEEVIVEAGSAVLISSPLTHQIINIGTDNLEFLAFCVPAWEPGNTAFPPPAGA